MTCWTPRRLVALRCIRLFSNPAEARAPIGVHAEMRIKSNKAQALAPSHPSTGDLVLLCAHGLCAHSVHFFYLPPDDGDRRRGYYFTRPDGSRQGPARWVVICAACFAVHADNPLNCPISADFRWPEGFRMPIRLSPERQSS